jgi:hypothetical protein
MILSADPPLAVERKSTIGGRKPAARKGVGIFYFTFYDHRQINKKCFFTQFNEMGNKIEALEIFPP